jgi:hypothetical protein
MNARPSRIGAIVVTKALIKNLGGIDRFGRFVILTLLGKIFVDFGLFW